jgi:glycosyltransferase involved in cell wall biosynthesis
MLTQEQVTLVIPSSNNLRHLKNAYTSIKKNAWHCKIVMLDDGSTDGTTEWLNGLSDDNITAVYRSSERVGHTILYDKGIELAETEIVGIMHADMILGPYYLENMLKHLQRETVVCATRVEPPLHPAGKEKIIRDFGTDFNNLNLDAFEAYVLEAQQDFKDQTTDGMFAPWIIYKEDFINMGGHDKLFAPFPYEDSDIFQRWMLHGYELIQSRDAFVYHLTCRGHRWTEEIGKDDDYFKNASAKAARNYLRKWGSWIENDEYQRPILKPRYDIGIVVENCTPNLLLSLEPWFNNVYVDQSIIADYIEYEQPKTDLILEARVRSIEEPKQNDIVIYFDAKDEQVDLNIITNIQRLIQVEVDEIGTYEYGGFKIDVIALTDHIDKMMGTFIKNVF